MPPTSQQIVVALEALEADAMMWQRAAEDLRTAAAAARRQEIPPHAFSFAGRAVADAYESMRVKAVALLEGGAANFDAIARALRASAAAYAADERAGAHRIKNTY
jgi:hypothetical protein